MVRIMLCGCATAAMLLAGCGGAKQTMDKMGSLEGNEPATVTVQHVLIAFDGSAASKRVTRSKDDARLLAEELYRRAVAGEDFDKLVEQYTDDSVPGVYGLANSSADADEIRKIYPRSKMAPAFGDVSFSLAPGEVGLAYYDGSRCKFGWHIIKRIR